MRAGVFCFFTERTQKSREFCSHCALSSPLKKAFLAFFNLAKLAASCSRLAKSRLTSRFCDRIHAIAQPVDFFNGLLAPVH